MAKVNIRKRAVGLDSDKHRIDVFIPFLLIIIMFRIIITFIEPYRIDMGGYLAWSQYLANHGPSGLYHSSGYHIVYAPFFQYFLWLTGEIVSLFNLSTLFHVFIIKIWSVAFEFLGAFLIFLIGRRYNKINGGAIAALIYAINPAIFMNSSIWGQFDSIPATMLLLTVYLFEIKKPNTGAIVFLVAVLTKPQSGLLLPVVLYLYFKDFRFGFKSLKRLFIGLSGGILVYLLIVLPFYNPTSKAGLSIPAVLDPFYWLFELYSRSIQDYPYATANGFNFWTLLGGQIRDDTLPFMGLSYMWWGNILLALSVIYALIILYKGKGSLQALLYSSFITLFSAFMFMTKMHERYLLPAIIFITLFAIWQKRSIITALLLSICVFSNQFTVYLYSFKEIFWLERWNTPALIIAGLTLFTYCLALHHGYRYYIKSCS